MTLRGRPVAALALLLGAWFVARRLSPVVRLGPHDVVVPGHPEDVRQRIEATHRSGNVVAAEQDRLVARFGGRAGPFSFHTVELTRFAPAEITYEHLGGTFLCCRERFVLRAEGADRTRICHDGGFKLRGGLFGWALGRLVVKRLFEDHVTRVLESSFG